MPDSVSAGLWSMVLPSLLVLPLGLFDLCLQAAPVESGLVPGFEGSLYLIWPGLETSHLGQGFPQLVS